MRNARLDELQADIKIGRRNINLSYVDDTILMAESEEELKSLLTKVKESGRISLKLNIKKPRTWHPAPFSSVQLTVMSTRGLTRFLHLLLQNKIYSSSLC